MAEESKPLGRLVADLQREFGSHYYGRRDLHIPEEMKQSAIQRARAESTRSLGRYRVVKKENLDGIKFFLDAPTNGNGAEAWILFRASGTEPLLRVYAEAASPELVDKSWRRRREFCRTRGTRKDAPPQRFAAVRSMPSRNSTFDAGVMRYF